MRFGWYIRGPHLGPVHTYWVPDRRPATRPASPAPRPRPGQVRYSQPRTAGTPKGWWAYVVFAAVVIWLASRWTLWAAVAAAVVFVALAVLAGVAERREAAPRDSGEFRAQHVPGSAEYKLAHSQKEGQ